MWKIGGIILFHSLVLCLSEDPPLGQIHRFCHQNQFNNVVLINFDQVQVFKEQYDWQIKRYHQNMSTQTSFIIAKAEKGSIFDMLTILKTHPVQKSLVIVLNPLRAELESTLANFQHDLSFYTLEEDKENKFHWYQIIALQNKQTVLKQSMEFDQNGKIIPWQNLQGIELKATTLPIAPWIDFQNCTTTKSCHYHGILVDLINSWTQLLNFTFVVHRDPTDDWGIYPINGKISLTDKTQSSTTPYYLSYR